MKGLVGVMVVMMMGAMMTRRDIAVSPPPATTVNIYGNVYDGHTETPIEGILVICGDSQAYTASDGYYLLEGIPAGAPISIVFTDPEQRYIERTITIEAGLTADLILNIRLFKSIA